MWGEESWLHGLVRSAWVAPRKAPDCKGSVTHKAICWFDWTVMPLYMISFDLTLLIMHTCAILIEGRVLGHWDISSYHVTLKPWILRGLRFTNGNSNSQVEKSLKLSFDQSLSCSSPVAWEKLMPGQEFNLMGRQISISTMEVSMAVPQKTKNRSTTRPSYTTQVYIQVSTHRDTGTWVFVALPVTRDKSWNQPGGSPTEGWIKQTGCIYTHAYERTMELRKN